MHHQVSDKIEDIALIFALQIDHAAAEALQRLLLVCFLFLCACHLHGYADNNCTGARLLQLQIDALLMVVLLCYQHTGNTIVLWPPCYRCLPQSTV